MMFFNKKRKEQKEIDLIVMAAHQLRRPLSSIRLSLQMLLRGDFGPLQPEQKDIVEKINGQNEILLCITNDVLEMARAEGNLSAPKAEYVDVAQIFDSALALNYEEITRKKITVDFNRPALPRLKLKKEALMVSLHNIIDNAVKYTRERGWIKILFSVHEKRIEITVQDSGIGIPDAEHKNIFVRFFRASNAGVMAPGSGVGLFIAKKVIEANGGKLWFESKEGAGSTFHISLPIE